MHYTSLGKMRMHDMGLIRCLSCTHWVHMGLQLLTSRKCMHSFDPSCLSVTSP